MVRAEALAALVSTARSYWIRGSWTLSVRQQFRLEWAWLGREARVADVRCSPRG